MKLAAVHGRHDLAVHLLSQRQPQDSYEEAFVSAGMQGHWSIVAQMLSHVDSKYNPSRALWWAAADGNVESVALLLPLSDPQPNHDLSISPLSVAAREGHLAVVRLLLPVSDPCSKQSQALHLAAKNKHADVVALLGPLAPLHHVHAMCDRLSTSDSTPCWATTLDLLAEFLPLDQAVAWHKKDPSLALPQLQARLLANDLSQTLESPLTPTVKRRM